MLNAKRVSQLRFVAVTAALAAGGVLTACKGKEVASTDTTATAMAPTDTSSMSGMAANAPLNDANIAALIDEVNVGDSTLAAAALPNLTNSGAKNFAKMMMGEHHAMHVSGLKVETDQKITPAMPASDPFKAAVDGETSALASATKGAAYDSTYIANEVGIHQAVIDWVGKNTPQNAAYQSYLKDSAPTLKKHLDRATALQKSMSHA